MPTSNTQKFILKRGLFLNIEISPMLLQQKKLFYDNFTDADVAGIFSFGHLCYLFAFILLSAVLLYLSRAITPERERKNRFIIAVSVTVMEIIKIWLRIYKGQHVDSWIPLYYCSLYIFAIWISLLPDGFWSRIGKTYIAMGGIMGAIIFTLVPTTSLGIYPALHPASLHSFLYHFLMFYSGITLFVRGGYRPVAFDFWGYFGFLSAAAIPSVIINRYLGTNCLFLNNAFGLPMLQPLRESSHITYMLIVFLAQAVLMFWGNYLFYRIALRIREKRLSLASKNN